MSSSGESKESTPTTKKNVMYDKNNDTSIPESNVQVGYTPRFSGSKAEEAAANFITLLENDAIPFVTLVDKTLNFLMPKEGTTYRVKQSTALNSVPLFKLRNNQGGTLDKLHLHPYISLRVKFLYYQLTKETPDVRNILFTRYKTLRQELREELRKKEEREELDDDDDMLIPPTDDIDNMSVAEQLQQIEKQMKALLRQADTAFANDYVNNLTKDLTSEFGKMDIDDRGGGGGKRNPLRF